MTNFFSWLLGKMGVTKLQKNEIPVKEIVTAWQELQVRELAFWSCVNLVADVVGKCEFQTYLGGKEVKRGEHYLWNYEPNVNQSSTVFLHKLIGNLFSRNEALVIPTKGREGLDGLVVADEWTIKGQYPAKQNQYTGVVVGQVQYRKTFDEEEVLHFQLHGKDIRPILNGLYNSYQELMAACMANYQWDHGRHMIVHVDSAAQGNEEAAKVLMETVNKQVKPFLRSPAAVLPEQNGYTYRDAGGNGASTSRDIRDMVNDIFDFTANGFGIPPVLLTGQVEGTQDAVKLLLTRCIDPLCDQLAEEIVRKRYGLTEWEKGNYLRIDTSAAQHFDMFGSADAVDKLISSGAFSINEVRERAGKERIDAPWADQHFITKNYSTVNGLLTALEGE